MEQCREIDFPAGRRNSRLSLRLGADIQYWLPSIAFRDFNPPDPDIVKGKGKGKVSDKGRGKSKKGQGKGRGKHKSKEDRASTLPPAVFAPAAKARNNSTKYPYHFLPLIGPTCHCGRFRPPLAHSLSHRPLFPFQSPPYSSGKSNQKCRVSNIASSRSLNVTHCWLGPL